MEKVFEDGEGEVEVRVKLPSNLSGAVANKKVSVDSRATSLRVTVSGGEPEVILDAPSLYDRVLSSETAWYVDGEWVVITLQKAKNMKWLALTDADYRALRFPEKSLSLKTREEKDASGAMAERSKVAKLLEAAQAGIEAFKESAKAFEEAGAAGGGHSEAMGAVRDGNERGPLHFAAKKGRLDVLEYLLGELGLPIDPPDIEGETPLIHAARGGHADAVLYLLEKGADPNAASSTTGTTSLHVAAGEGWVGVVRALLEHGADVNAKSDTGTALLWAAGHGKVEVVEVLLDAGAALTLVNDEGVDPLLTAASAGEEKVVELLLKRGADPNVSAGGGVTPLHVAANKGQLSMVRRLLAAGADPNMAEEEDGAKPIDAAASQGEREAVELLLAVTTPDPSLPEWSVDMVLAKAQHPSASPQAQEAVAASGAAAGGGVGAEGEGGGRGAAAAVEDGVAGVGGGVGGEAGAQGVRSDTHAGATSNQPDGVDPARAADALSAKERGNAAFKKRDYTAALDAYTQAVDLQPGDASVLANRSMCWLRLGQGEEALADAEAARRVRPEWGKAYYREGMALRLLQRYEDAATTLFEGVQKEPGNLELARAFKETVELGKEHHRKAMEKAIEESGHAVKTSDGN